MKGSAQPRMDNPVKIGFVLLSPAAQPIPSTRVAVLNMFPYLREQGFDPHIVFEPAVATQTPEITLTAEQLSAQGFRIVCFQKVSGPSVLDLAKKLSSRGIRTVFMLCDVVDAEMAQATDVTVVVTDFLRSIYPAGLRGRIHVVHDGIERPDVCKTAWRADRGSPAAPLKAILVTSARLETLPVLVAPPPWLHVTVMGRYPRYAGPWHAWRDRQWYVRQHSGFGGKARALRFLLHPRIECVPWHPEAVYDALVAADVGIIPIDRPPAEPGDEAPLNWQVKSENRLTLKMSVGLPVVATPIPAYEPVVRQGDNGFLVGDRKEWLACLEQLRDPDFRRDVGTRARASVADRYSMNRQAQRLVQVLRILVGG